MFGKNPFSQTGVPPMHTNPMVKGTLEANPVADQIAKKRKKYNANPGSSLTGLRKAAMGPGAMPGGIPGMSGGPNG